MTVIYKEYPDIKKKIYNITGKIVLSLGRLLKEFPEKKLISFNKLRCIIANSQRGIPYLKQAGELC